MKGKYNLVLKVSDNSFRDVHESNLFLLKFWSLFSESGSLGWQTFGLKRNNEVDLGYMDAEVLSTTYNVKVFYKRRGIVSRLVFIPSSKPKKDDEIVVKDLFDKAKKYYKQTLTYTLGLTLKTYGIKVANYSSDHLDIYGSDDGFTYIDIQVNAFCETTAEKIGKPKLFTLIDILSLVTPNSYERDGIAILDNRVRLSKSNTYREGNFHNDEAERLSKAMISRKEIELMNLIIKSNEREYNQSFLGAIKIFSLASKYKRTLIGQKGFGITDGSRFMFNLSSNEVVLTLLISSLESAIDSVGKYETVNCNGCGQKKYSIRKRVLSYVEEFFDDTSMRKYFDDIYSRRSSFLHTANHIGNNSYTGVSLPTLSNTGEMVNEYSNFNMLLLDDYVSLLLRGMIEKEEMRIFVKH